MAGGFKPIKPIVEHAVDEKVSDDFLYWERMKEHSVFQEPGNISSTAFLPVSPHFLAATSSIRLSVFDTTVCEPVSVYSRFRSVLWGATYRSDGTLLGIGSQDGYVHFFDVHKGGTGPRNPLRSFQAHKSAVHTLGFAQHSRNVATMADDGDVRIWDISVPKGDTPVWQTTAHSDHIRCGAFTNESDNLILTGSYDHAVKLWDTRANSKEPAIAMDHEAPVEKLLLFPNDRILITAGGTRVKMWDLAAGGKLIHHLENHNRTVTSLAFATNKSRLLTGGLDRRINVFRLDSGTFDLVYSFKTAAPVLTLSMAANDECMAFGMSNLLSIYRRHPKPVLYPATTDPRDKVKRKALVGDSSTTTRIAAPMVTQRERGGEPTKVELTAKVLDKMSLGTFDFLIRGHKYRKLVDQIFQSRKVCQQQPEIAVAALQQIRLQGKLHVVLAGRPSHELIPIIEFLRVNLFRPAFFEALYDVTNTLFTVYAEEELSSKAIERLNALKNAVAKEVSLQKSICRTLGTLDMVIRAAMNTQRENRANTDDSIFGELLITPVAFTMSDSASAQASN